MTVKLHHGDCLDVLRTMPDSSVDSIVTDPPYGLKFMGKKWDYDVPDVEIWAECLRVLKPGGHLLAFSGTRTQHRMAFRIEDAGFEIRDMIAWVYGSGFPKSLDVSKAIDKSAGAERQRYECQKFGGTFSDDNGTTYGTAISDEAITDDAKKWQGWGTALKPALEPITVARKPLIGTVATNVLAHGTGAINIDACRVGNSGSRTNSSQPRADRNGFIDGFISGTETVIREQGRWPANLIHDGSDEVVALFPLTAGDSISADRFFYCAKASRKDRNEGLDGFELRRSVDDDWISEGRKNTDGGGIPSKQQNHHPTVKPTDLMRYLCRLVTPPGGVVLDPFMGSGSTGKAAVLEGFNFIGIEREAEYIEIARARIADAQKKADAA
ncbi:DNA-methyltransferase [Pectobacterium brasiliense]|uniref:DNA-methyltransferase n=1 Tax=Pectobacterium brasiliense TaxID=180957 RepID=UPI003AFAD612